MRLHCRIGLFTTLFCLIACGGSGGGGPMPSITVEGKVVDGVLRPIAGAAVKVGSQNAVSDSNGQFSISNVTPPYDLTVTVMSPTKVGVLFQGLGRADPTILVPGVHASQNSGMVSGNLTGVYPLGTISEKTVIAWGSPEIPFLPPTTDVNTDPYTLDLTWVGPSSTTGTVHALQWQLDPNHLPTTYTGYGTTPSVTVTNSGTTNADVAMSAPSASTIAGSITVPASFTIASKSFAIAFPDRAGIALGFDSTPSASFTYPFPAVSGGTATVRAEASLSGDSSAIQLFGIAPGTTNLALNLPTPSTAILPADMAANVGTNTDFTWTSMSGTVYVLQIQGPSGAPSYYVITAATTARIPDLADQGLGLPAAGQYAWNVLAVGPWASVDEIAGPTPNQPPGNTKFEGLTANRKFTTP